MNLRKLSFVLAGIIIAFPIFTIGVYAANTVIRSIAVQSSTIDSSPIGATTPSTGVFTNVTDTALSSGNCVQAGASGILTTLAFPCAGPNPGVITKILSGNVAVSTSTTVDSQSVTMPSSGCPCRVLISYNYFEQVTSAGSGDVMFAYVTDGSSDYAMSQIGLVANNTQGAVTSTQMSTTYANSAVVTFTVKAGSTATPQINRANPTNAALISYLQLVTEYSN